MASGSARGRGESETAPVNVVGMGYYSNYGDKNYHAIATGGDAAESDRSSFEAPAVFRRDKVKGDKNLDALISLRKLPDLTEDAEMVRKLKGGSGNDGYICQVFLDGKAHALKVMHNGVTKELLRFHEALLKYSESTTLQPTGKLKVHPGADAVLRVVIPVGFMVHETRKGLVFPWIYPPKISRKLTAKDFEALRAQVDFCHLLGFCHLDITARNVLLSDQQAYLVDYDCVCGIDRSVLFPVAPENTLSVKQAQPVSLEDDEHLWNRLKQTIVSADTGPNTLSSQAPAPQPPPVPVRPPAISALSQASDPLRKPPSQGPNVHGSQDPSRFQASYLPQKNFSPAPSSQVQQDSPSQAPATQAQQRPPSQAPGKQPPQAGSLPPKSGLGKFLDFFKGVPDPQKPVAVPAKQDSGSSASHAPATRRTPSIRKPFPVAKVQAAPKRAHQAGSPNKSLSLFTAAEFGDLATLQWRLKEGRSSIKKVGPFGMTAFLCAARSGHLPKVQWLLKDGGASIKERDCDGRTAFLWAAFRGHLPLMQWLLHEGGASIKEADTEGATALLWASRGDHLPVVQWLLKQGSCSVKEVDKHGRTALLYAAGWGHLPIVQWLLKQGGASVKESDQRGMTALLKASQWNHFPVVQWLLKAGGASVKEASRKGKTAVDLAVDSEELQVFLKSCN